MISLKLFQIGIEFLMFILIGLTALKNKKVAFSGAIFFILYTALTNIQF